MAGFDLTNDLTVYRYHNCHNISFGPVEAFASRERSARSQQSSTERLLQERDYHRYDLVGRYSDGVVHLHETYLGMPFFCAWRRTGKSWDSVSDLPAECWRKRCRSVRLNVMRIWKAVHVDV